MKIYIKKNCKYRLFFILIFSVINNNYVLTSFEDEISKKVISKEDIDTIVNTSQSLLDSFKKRFEPQKIDDNLLINLKKTLFFVHKLNLTIEMEFFDHISYFGYIIKYLRKKEKKVKTTELKNTTIIKKELLIDDILKYDTAKQKTLIQLNEDLLIKYIVKNTFDNYVTKNISQEPETIFNAIFDEINFAKKMLEKYLKENQEQINEYMKKILLINDYMQKINDTISLDISITNKQNDTITKYLQEITSDPLYTKYNKERFYNFDEITDEYMDQYFKFIDNSVSDDKKLLTNPEKEPWEEEDSESEKVEDDQASLVQQSNTPQTSQEQIEDEDGSSQLSAEKQEEEDRSKHFGALDLQNLIDNLSNENDQKHNQASLERQSNTPQISREQIVVKNTSFKSSAEGQEEDGSYQLSAEKQEEEDGLDNNINVQDLQNFIYNLSSENDQTDNKALLERQSNTPQISQEQIEEEDGSSVTNDNEESLKQDHEHQSSGQSSQQDDDQQNTEVQLEKNKSSEQLSQQNNTPQVQSHILSQQENNNEESSQQDHEHQSSGQSSQQNDAQQRDVLSQESLKQDHEHQSSEQLLQQNNTQQVQRDRLSQQENDDEESSQQDHEHQSSEQSSQQNNTQQRDVLSQESSSQNNTPQIQSDVLSQQDDDNNNQISINDENDFDLNQFNESIESIIPDKLKKKLLQRSRSFNVVNQADNELDQNDELLISFHLIQQNQLFSFKENEKLIPENEKLIPQFSTLQKKFFISKQYKKQLKLSENDSTIMNPESINTKSIAQEETNLGKKNEQKIFEQTTYQPEKNLQQKSLQLLPILDDNSQRLNELNTKKQFDNDPTTLDTNKDFSWKAITIILLVVVGFVSIIIASLLSKNKKNLPLKNTQKKIKTKT